MAISDTPLEITVVIEVSQDEPGPIKGTLRTASAARQTFTGWIGLVSALRELMDGAIAEDRR